MDNAAFLDHMTSRILAAREKPHYVMGTLLSDPNGFDGFPRETIARFAQNHPRIDLVLNVNISLLARVRGAQEKGQKGFEDWPDFAGLIASFPRAHWLIRNPQRVGGLGDRFSIAVGRTINLEPKYFMDFWPLHSSPGQHILTTYRRWDDGQKELFRRVV